MQNAGKGSGDEYVVALTVIPESSKRHIKLSDAQRATKKDRSIAISVPKDIGTRPFLKGSIRLLKLCLRRASPPCTKKHVNLLQLRGHSKVNVQSCLSNILRDTHHRTPLGMRPQHRFVFHKKANRLTAKSRFRATFPKYDFTWNTG